MTPEEIETKLGEFESRFTTLTETISSSETKQSEQVARVEKFWGEIVKVEEKINAVSPIADDLETKIKGILEKHDVELPKLQSISDKISEIDSYFTDYFTRKDGPATKSKHEMMLDHYNEMTDLLTAVAGERKEISDFKVFVNGEGTKSNTGFKSQIETWHKESDKKATELYDGHKESFDTIYKKIEGLVEGATTIGLAKSFQDQKKGYMPSIRLYLSVFIVTVVFLIWYAVQNYVPPVSLEASLMHLVSHLPLYGACVWLALFAAKKLNQNIRLRQEYAYKETLARAYEGHLREIQKLPEDANRNDLLKRHLEIMILTSAFNPSSTLDSKSHDEKGPFLVELLKKVFPGSKGVKEGE